MKPIGGLPGSQVAGFMVGHNPTVSLVLMTIALLGQARVRQRAAFPGVTCRPMLGATPTSEGQMGVQGTMGRVDVVVEPHTGDSGIRPVAHPLKVAAAFWEACPAFQKDAQKDRQFLATFAIYLVQHFRAEESRLLRARTPKLARYRVENHLLALRLCDLMADAEVGLDVRGISAASWVIGGFTRYEHPPGP